MSQNANFDSLDKQSTVNSEDSSTDSSQPRFSSGGVTLPKGSENLLETLIPPLPTTERTINFGTEHSMGELYALAPDDKITLIGDAKGKLTLSSSARLTLYYNFDSSLGLSPLDNLGPDELYGISFLGTEVTDHELAHMSRLTGLRELDVSCTQVGDAGLACLKPLTHLTKLTLSSTKISSLGLSMIAELTSLRELIVDDTQITDETVRHLLPLTGLHTLSLSFTSISNRGMAAIKEMRSLRKLRLNGCNVTNDGLMFLQKLVNLRELWLRNTQVSYPGLIELCKWLPDCEIII